MSKIKLVLQYLRQAGSTGVHSFQLNTLVHTDRAAARIDDLKRIGYKINSVRERLGNAWGVRYYLQSSPMDKPKILRYEYQGNTAIPIYE